eukprot:1046617-Amorphochlora_amoeboformis.AAC.1
MTVAKLYISKREGIWYDTGAWGVIVLTIDRENEKLPHLLKLLDMGSFKIIFQQEVYEMMQYRVPEPDFHSFEIPEMVVGFRFASMEEAKEFGSKVRGRLQVLIEKTAQRNNEAESKGLLLYMYGLPHYVDKLSLQPRTAAVEVLSECFALSVAQFLEAGGHLEKSIKS